MKRVTSKVSYLVPRWNYCNSDNLFAGQPNNLKCRFCQKTKAGYKCVLYDEDLSAKGHYIDKTPRCCNATAGVPSTIIQPEPQSGPTITPQEIMRQTIDLYDKTVRDLVAQGFPQNMANAAARKYVLGDK